MGNQKPRGGPPVNPFQRAERRTALLRLALTGPSNAGKSYSALRLATGISDALGGVPIAAIDTENDSLALYSDRFVFDGKTIDPPYRVEKYIELIEAAVQWKYMILIIDSISHAWAGEGGLLQQKEDLDARGVSGDKKHKNQYTNWAPITKQHEAFRAWLLKCDVHIICTMRSKQDYVLLEDGRVQKVGMAPIQREGIEYEFTTVLDLGRDHKATVSKDRTGMYDGKEPFLITESTGQELVGWLHSGKPSQHLFKRLGAAIKFAGWTGDQASAYAAAKYEKADSQSLTVEQVYEFIRHLETEAAKKTKDVTPGNGEDPNAEAHAAAMEGQQTMTTGAPAVH